MSDQDLTAGGQVVSLMLRRERLAALSEARDTHSTAFQRVVKEQSNPMRRALAVAEARLANAYQEAAKSYRPGSPTWAAMRHASMYLNYSVGLSPFGDVVRAELLAEARKARGAGDAWLPASGGTSVPMDTREWGVRR